MGSEILFDDEELLYYYRQGNEEAIELLLENNTGLFNHIVNEVAALWIKQRPDLRDECLSVVRMSFLRCVEQFRESKKVKFTTYFYDVAQKDLTKWYQQEVIRHHYEISNDDVLYAMADHKNDIFMIMEARRALDDVEKDSGLTELEKIVFQMDKAGYSTKQICEKMGYNERTVYNARGRVRNKKKKKG